MDVRSLQTTLTSIATNQPFAAWDELFDNEALATAMVDRLVYGSITLDLSGISYRYEHARSQLATAAARSDPGRQDGGEGGSVQSRQRHEGSAAAAAAASECGG